MCCREVEVSAWAAPKDSNPVKARIARPRKERGFIEIGFTRTSFPANDETLGRKWSSELLSTLEPRVLLETATGARGLSSARSTQAAANITISLARPCATRLDYRIAVNRTSAGGKP